MKRALLALVVAVSLLLPSPTGAIGLFAAVRNTDGAAVGNGLSITSSAAISDLTAGAVWAWFLSTNVSNTARNVFAKNVGGPGGYEMFRRGVDGTAMRVVRYRSTGTPLTIDSPTGTLQANVPTFMFSTFDMNSLTNCKMWKGTIDIPAAQLSPTLSLGSGAGASDLAQAMIVANSTTAGQGWPGIVWAIGVSTATDFTLEEVRRLQYAPNPRTFRRCAGMWVFNGTPVRDLCGNGNHGTLIGTGRLSPDYLPRVQFGFRRSL